MILIIEILMTFGGIWATTTGRLPSFLFGSPPNAQASKIRLLGLWLVLTFPLAVAGSIAPIWLMGGNGTVYAALGEIIGVAVVALVALLAFQTIKQPVPIKSDRTRPKVADESQIDSIIASKAQGALIYALLGALGFTAFVVCPLAFHYGTQALRLIDQYHSGEANRGKARLARILATIIFLFYAAIVFVFVLALMIGGTR